MVKKYLFFPLQIIPTKAWKYNLHFQNDGLQFKELEHLNSETKSREKPFHKIKS